MAKIVNLIWNTALIIGASAWVGFTVLVDWLIGLDRADSATRVLICVVVLFLAVYGFLAINFVGSHMAPRV